MMISTRGRYALRVMLDLAQHEGYVPLRDVAERQALSQKYAESIMTVLSKHGLVDGRQGKGGGYCLNRPASAYSVGELLRLTEGSLAPVACLEDGAIPCERACECRTRPMWTKLDHMISSYLDSVSLQDLLTP